MVTEYSRKRRADETKNEEREKPSMMVARY
jgi:hypothetical protein